MSASEAIAYAQRGRGERKRPSSGWASLTPTELDVARLVSEGLANKDIATRLPRAPWRRTSPTSTRNSGSPRACNWPRRPLAAPETSAAPMVGTRGSEAPSPLSATRPGKAAIGGVVTAG